MNQTTMNAVRWQVLKIGFTLLSLFITFLAQAQEYYAFSPIDSKDGLSENRVKGITQLSDGRMIFVTDGLINLYDGTSFHYMHYDDEKVYPLAGYNGFHHSYVDGEGHLWIKDYQRLMLFDIRKESYVLNVDSVLLRQGIRSRLSDFFMDSEHTIWYLTKDDQMLYRNNLKKTTSLFLSKFSRLSGKKDQLFDLAVYQDKVYFFYKSGLMICCNLNTRKELYRENPFEGKSKGLYERTLLVVPWKQYLYQIRNGKTGMLLRYDVKVRKWETILKPDYTLNTLSIDHKGDIWASCPQGLWKIKKDLQEKRHIKELQLLDGRIFKTEINTQYNDTKGGLWIGTFNRGLLYFHPDRFKFRNVGRTLFDTKNNQELKVQCFTENKGDILIGTTKGLFLYSKNSQKLVPFPGLSEKIQPQMLMKDSKQQIWICAGNDGLFCINGKKTKHFTFPHRSIFYLHETPQGFLYLCTDKGFALFDPLSGSFEQRHVTKKGKLNAVYQLIDYGPNSLIGFSDAGLFTYDFGKDTLYIPGNHKGKKPAMFYQSNHQYNCLFLDSRKILWFGTQDGLNVWNPKTSSLRQFHTENGLINNRIQSIIEDNQNRIWVSTPSGLSRIDLTENNQYSFTNYNHFDGVISNEFIERSVYKTESGLLLWGGIDGFNAIDTKLMNKGQQPLATPLFVKLFLFGTEIKQGQKYGGKVLLEQAIASTKSLNLKHDQNFFTVEFSALNYINPTQTFYRYQLEGVDKTWHELTATDGIGRANYTDLSPGTYILKVFATNDIGKWNNNCAEMTVVINPPFWRTPTAYTVYALFVFLSCYFSISFYAERNKQKLKRQQKEELDQMKYRFFTNMSHELRTPLTLIITPLDALLKKMDESTLKAQLTGIYNSANDLLKIVNQLLDFRKLEMNGETLRLSSICIDEFIESISYPFKSLAQNKEITFRLTGNLTDLYVYVDKDKLQKIVNNLLFNAYKFTPKGGTITLHLDKCTMPNEQVEAFLIKVTDTGCGIPEKELPNIFTRFYQVESQSDLNTGSGIGLNLIQEYVRLHNGCILAESNVNQGSVFTVYIPLNLQPMTEEVFERIENKNGTTFKLLVVEDNKEFLAFLVNHLSENFTVLSSTNGREALEKAIESEPDLIISDIMMPEMNGLELCRNLKSNIRISHIPVILLTARSSDDAQIEGYKAGADAYISKPFNLDILNLQINNLIERQIQRKDLFRKAIIIRPESITSTSIDEKLITSAIKCVEKNLNNPHYSVEKLSKDMNMDRTGLYRKLIAIVGQTPTEFIRSIRLKRATILLKQGVPVSEVSDLVGFGTVSYFSKCFQEEYGIKPSQYDED